jgi:hypothetical protein
MRRVAQYLSSGRSRQRLNTVSRPRTEIWRYQAAFNDGSPLWPATGVVCFMYTKHMPQPCHQSVKNPVTSMSRTVQLADIDRDRVVAINSAGR